MTERQMKILANLNENGEVEVAALSEALGVSTVTIRKDLVLLEEKGLLKRQHGYAVRSSENDIGYRMAFAYHIKKRIAAKAASLVENGETIMIESGSTCAMLAMELAGNRQDVTIITNSAYIAEAIRRLPGAKVVLLGGAYDAEAQVTTGPLIAACAEKFYVDKFFIGTDGFDPEQGFFSNLDLFRAEAVNEMGRFAGRKIILTDSSKFNQRSVVRLLYPTEVSVVITDDIPENCRKSLLASGVELLLV